jgi:predicted nucleic acid-binding Zn ribbon protein
MQSNVAATVLCGEILNKNNNRKGTKSQRILSISAVKKINR